MAIHDPAKGSGTSKKKSRGTVRNPSRLEAFSKGSGGGLADWGSCDCNWVQAVVVRITAMGGAVTFGLSRDNGAHSLSLMLDGHRETLWFNGDADLNDELQRVVVTLEDMA